MKLQVIRPKREPSLSFVARPGSSDSKSLAEVIDGRGYARKGFPDFGPWVDLGANVGAFTVLMASRGHHVDAYEADPDSYALLCENVKRNGLQSRVRTFHCAVTSDHVREMTLYVNGARGNFWRNSVVKPWRGGTQRTVPAAHWSTLDMQRRFKIDIEGSEMPIIEDMIASGAFPPALVFEWSFDIDRSILRFQRAVAGLRKHYSNVVYPGFDETAIEWAPEWFPPCRTAWCY